ncbi:Hydrogenase maturation protein HydF [Ignavibacterium album JCM 16511]|uniref:Hydrogenase maturation protein HydF n=1 Tax=Ignavibacterium album (strain DSM 19864 / JCM 16511 / NBRC 101810 / Mat9-16) TaxID=945713 RepID=I0AGY3_IGNAJ|nr:[FeFe] hydrogenase H-cluster maturation GTPase HydF [Ignavibacterium album]AFH48240.1 Hydrogenase maturation protein HydF [Ignavibacterium album JCM 16511]
MNKVAEANRPHIAIVGRRNVGKSSLVNALLGQDLSIVSDVPGTTTDPVKKAFELLPYGPVVLVDTAGIDDEGELGQKRISKTIKILSQSDFALVVLDARERLQSKELELLAYLDKISVNYIVAINKIEFGVNPKLLDELKELRITHFEVSCKEKVGIDELKRKMIRMLPAEIEPPLISDIVSQGDVVVMVVPIDLGAPKGRLILPQVQTIREALDEDTIVIVCKDKELRSILNNLKNYPDLVITDSQAIMRVAADVPEKVKLTTFSILMARHKGDLPTFVRGLKRVEELENGDKVLIAEACTHHAQADDIGTVKIPRWLRNHTRKNLQIDIAHGADYPDNLSDYKLIVHCGGCMLTRRAMLTRMNEAKLLDVPIVNYGVLISYMHGAIPRALRPFEEAIAEWERLKVNTR